LYLTILMVLLVLEFGGMGIVYAEVYEADSNIKTTADGVWWAFVTITTVGYGDHFPVTNLGRQIGFVVMVLGVGTFGVLTGFLANAFLSPDDSDAAQSGEDATEVEVSELKRLLREQELANSRIMSKLERIEASISSQGEHH
jgi:voltage-gated potassium channel